MSETPERAAISEQVIGRCRLEVMYSVRLPKDGDAALLRIALAQIVVPIAEKRAETSRSK